MSDHADTIRRALRPSGLAIEGYYALDALLAERQQAQEERDRYRIEADCAMRDYDGLEVRFGEALDALREARKQAEPRDWETSGHPMNEWTKREPILRIIDAALAKLGEKP